MTAWFRPQALLVLPPILVGIAVLAWAVFSRRTPETSEISEVARPLRVLTLQRRDVRPQVIAYGPARPARIWRAVAELGGEVIETHSQLDAGIEVSADTRLLTLDPTDFELRVDRLQARAAALRAELRELEQTRANQSELLQLEQESLRVAEAESERLRELWRRDAASDSEVDRQRQQRLSVERSVVSLKHSLRLNPIRREQLEATLRGTEKEIALARRDLARTVIRAPFDGRLAGVFIREGQVVSAGQELFELHGTEVVEVEARIPWDDLPSLLPPDAMNGKGERKTDPGETDDAPRSGNGTPAIRRSLAAQLAGTPAVIRIHSGQWVRELSGEVSRVRESVDARTRTLGVVVSVPQRPDAPLLLPETFAEVELIGPVRTGRLVVPESALRGNDLFVVDTDSRLDRRRVTRQEKVPDGYVVTGEIEAGDRVVTTDPMPSVVGSLIEPIENRTADRRQAAADHREP